MKLTRTKKAPHYFLVHFDETFTGLTTNDIWGKPYIIICDGIATNVYGFKSEAEAKAFDPLKLRSLLRGCRSKRELWDAPDEATLLEQIKNDPRVIAGVYTLSTHTRYGPIENLPTCKRMYIGSEGLLCGKPTNEFGDGCYGGCVLQGFDQDEPFYDGFVCPMHTYWDNQFAKVMAED